MIEVGTKVMYSRNFLRSEGAITGPLGFATEWCLSLQGDGNSQELFRWPHKVQKNAHFSCT